MLTIKPDGGLLKMPLSYLEGSPFSDYLVPGVILLCVLGIFPLVVAYGLLRRRPWAWFGACAVGCGLMIFEVVEYGVIGFNVQQPIWGTSASSLRSSASRRRCSTPAGCAGGTVPEARLGATTPNIV